MVYGAFKGSRRNYERITTSLAKRGGPRVSVVESSNESVLLNHLPYCKQCFIVKFFIKERKYNNGVKYTTKKND